MKQKKSFWVENQDIWETELGNRNFNPRIIFFIKKKKLRKITA